MKKQCRVSGANFEVTHEDLAMLEKLSPSLLGERVTLPPPTLSPIERQRRRISFRNERKLYHRKCSLTGKAIISTYSPDKPYLVYGQNEWWSDRWDPAEYGRAFDFSRPFFEQFHELMLTVPRVALFNRGSINSDYTNISADNKDCYLIVESSNNQACYYGHWLQRCSDCIDCAFCHLCELCYEVANGVNCYALAFSSDCKECSESYFLQGCTGCQHCIACCNLVKQEYCIFNVKYTKEEYEQYVAKFALDTHLGVTTMRTKANDFFLRNPKRYAEILSSEECTGNYIVQSKNCVDCFHAHEAQDCRHSVHVWRNSKDNMDCDTAGRDAELIYESINNGINVYQNSFCMTCWSCHNLLYCDSCSSTHHCFGSIGLRQKEYSILNTSYSRNEYEKLAYRIVEHMKETGEWGEFFPPSLSCYGYNESAANDYYPLTQDEARRRGFKWYHEESSSTYQGSIYSVPQSIRECGDEISSKILVCESSEKPYKIIPQEVGFYRNLNIPPPRRSPDQRHRDRLATRTPRVLFKRSCTNCGEFVETPYAPDRLERIVCERCYLSEA